LVNRADGRLDGLEDLVLKLVLIRQSGDVLLLRVLEPFLPNVAQFRHAVVSACSAKRGACRAAPMRARFSAQ
jgi:hypothetical protein